MFDIGGPEALLLVILGLLIFGPRRLPEIGKQLGGFIAQMRHAMREFQGTLEREVALEDVKEVTRQVGQLKQEATGFARELTGIGPPPYADPARQPPLPEPAPGTPAVRPGEGGQASVASPADLKVPSDEPPPAG